MLEQHGNTAFLFDRNGGVAAAAPAKEPGKTSTDKTHIFT
jgi:hypothetical protein